MAGVSLRKWLISGLAIILAVYLSTRLLRMPGQGTSPQPVLLEEQLWRFVPDADPLLVNRVAATWGYTAVEAARQHGEAGLEVLETFGDESAYYLKENPKAFGHCSADSEIALDRVDDRFYTTGPNLLLLRGAHHVRTG